MACLSDSRQFDRRIQPQVSTYRQCFETGNASRRRFNSTKIPVMGNEGEEARSKHAEAYAWKQVARCPPNRFGVPLFASSSN